MKTIKHTIENAMNGLIDKLIVWSDNQEITENERTQIFEHYFTAFEQGLRRETDIFFIKKIAEKLQQADLAQIKKDIQVC